MSYFTCTHPPSLMLIKGILVKKTDFFLSLTSSQKPPNSPSLPHMTMPKPSISKENGIPWIGLGNPPVLEWTLVVVVVGSPTKTAQPTKIGK